jgi:hypothetical protein
LIKDKVVDIPKHTSIKGRDLQGRQVGHCMALEQLTRGLIAGYQERVEAQERPYEHGTRQHDKHHCTACKVVPPPSLLCNMSHGSEKVVQRIHSQANLDQQKQPEAAMVVTTYACPHP